MPKKCPVTKKGPLVGNNVSHANNKVKRRWLPNLQVKRFWLEEESRWVCLRLTARAIRCINKRGLKAVLADMKSSASAA